jgi:hypothetical protein
MEQEILVIYIVATDDVIKVGHHQYRRNYILEMTSSILPMILSHRKTENLIEKTDFFSFYSKKKMCKRYICHTYDTTRKLVTIKKSWKMEIILWQHVFLLYRYILSCLFVFSFSRRFFFFVFINPGSDILTLISILYDLLSFCFFFCFRPTL